METREFEVRAVDGEDRIIEGIAVPYHDTIDVGGVYRERFQRGVFGFVSGVKLLYQHKEPIGRVDGYEDSEDGLRIRARISHTPRGDEVYTLLRDGVLDHFSVGFIPVEETRDEDGTVVRTKANLKEVSVVAFPAYQNATVTAVRNEPEPTIPIEDPTIQEDPVEQSTPAVDVEAREQLADLERRMAVISIPTSGDSVPQFRSQAEFVRALAQGDDKAADLYAQLQTRAFAGGVAGATVSAPDPILKNSWVSDSVRLLDFGRPTMNAFRIAALPADGMTIEWPEVATDSIQVAQQAAEADNLTYGKISLRSKTSPVNTYGGYATMSRQAIERSSLNYLDVVLRAQTIHYAKATNAAVVTSLNGLTGTGTTTAAATSAGWIGAIADASAHIFVTSGLRPEFILCSVDVFKKIVKLVDGTDRGAVAAANPQNNTGTANIPGLSATVMGLPVIVDPALASPACYVANSEAFVSYESSGAPMRLQDSDVVNLTSEFSVYGYLALATPIPGAIVKVTAS